MFNFNSKLNSIMPVFVAKLDLKFKSIKKSTKNINNSLLIILNIITTQFSIQNSLKKARFLEKSFLLFNINIKVISKIFFLIFSNTNIKFIAGEFPQNFYQVIKVLLMVKRLKVINKHKFVKIDLNTSLKIFVIYIVVSNAS